MAGKTKLADSLTSLLDASDRPIYAVDARRQIVYCNAPLAAWVGMKPARIVGREVEYHSEPAATAAENEALGPLAALCPPPAALAGKPCCGTVSCVGQDGRLVHRRADFISLAAHGGGVLVMLADVDLSPQELAAEIAGESIPDELHRTIWRFRRLESAQHGLPSLLGRSTAIRKVREQAAAAAASGANTLILGPPGSGRSHVARVVHYRGVADGDVKLVAIDCRVLTDDMLRRAIDSLQIARDDARHRPTLLLENLEQLHAAYQARLVDLIGQNSLKARLIGTMGSRPPQYAVVESQSDASDTSSANATVGDSTRRVPAPLNPALLDSISTIAIRIPRLVERLEDLPLLAQYFLEALNQGRTKQIGSLRPDALDQLALYPWPGELNELRDVIAAAHRTATPPEITARDLPVVIHHATSAAGRVRRRPEPIVLDDLLATIEKELIERALAQADGNKTEAASLLGMTRPRLYRRLVQLGLAGDDDGQQPEFIEQPDPEEKP